MIIMINVIWNKKKLPLGMLNSSRSFSQLAKLAANACDIFWLVPGVNGGTCIGRSKFNIKNKIKTFHSKYDHHIEYWDW